MISVLVIQVTVAVALIVGISDLLPEFLAHALGIGSPLQSAGAVSSGALQTFLYGLDDLFILIQPDSHGDHILS